MQEGCLIRHLQTRNQVKNILFISTTIGHIEKFDLIIVNRLS